MMIIFWFDLQVSPICMFVVVFNLYILMINLFENEMANNNAFILQITNNVMIFILDLIKFLKNL